jgi:very-short-patch-repair endonuclease
MVFSKIINESKHLHGAELVVKHNARLLRKNMTPAEKILWNKLKKRQLLGLHFRRQHPFGIYVLDFFCSKLYLSIEVDGKRHLSLKDKDLERTDYLRSAGVIEIRVLNSEVENRLDSVINKIINIIQREFPSL